MNNKQKKIVALSLSIVTGIMGITLAATQFDTSIVNALFTNKANTDTDYVLNLNSANIVTSEGDKIIKTARGNDVTFTYTGVSSSTSGHVTLNSNGAIVNKDHIRSIENITCNYSGSGTLKFRLSYGGGVWNDYVTVQSGYEFELTSNPYYVEFKAFDSQVTISSIKIGYSCVDTISQHSTTEDVPSASYYQKVESASSVVGDYLIVYENSETEAYVFDGSLTTLDAEGNYVTANIDSNGHIAASTSVEAAEFSFDSDGYIQSSSGYYIYNSSSTKNQLQTTSTKSGATSNTVSVVDGELIVTADANTSLRFNNATTNGNRFRYYKSGQQAICLYEKVQTSGGTITTYDTPTEGVFENGFNATDSKATTYKTADTYDTANGLNVYSTDTDGGHHQLSKGGANGYSYVVKNSQNEVIDSSKPFGGEDDGTYTVVVSYKNYIPVEIQISVEYVVALTGIEVNSSTLTFNTAQKLSDFTSGITANLTYNKSSENQQNVPYSAFATKGVSLSLIDPTSVTRNITDVFGTAGEWKIKVSSDANSSVYGELNITVNAISVTNISVTSSKTELEEGEQLQLIVNVTPNNATNPAVTWSSSVEGVATVTSSGLVTAVSASVQVGNTTVNKTTIKATATDGSNVFGSIEITVTEKPKGADEGEYTLLSGSLTVGDYVIFASTSDNGDAYAMGAQSSNIRSAIATTISSQKITKDSNSTFRAFLVREGLVEDTYAFYDPIDEGYLCATSSTSNNIGTQTTLDNNGSWTVSGAAEATITAQGTNSKKVLKYNYNNGNPRFTCYGTNNTTQTLPALFTKAGVVTYPTSLSVSSDATNNTIGVGETTQLTVGYTPTDTTYKTVTYSSGNTAVATVSATGLVTGVKAGDAVITVTGYDGEKDITASITIHVTNVAVTGVSISPTAAVSISVGGTQSLTASVSPSNATEKGVTWTSDTPSVATVDTNGVVTGVAAGTAIITATTKGFKSDGTTHATATKTVTVTASGGGSGGGLEETTYTFNSKTWGATPTNWTSGMDGYAYDNGIQVTTGASGANGTSPISFEAVQEVVVEYRTNASKGEGSIDVQVGSTSLTTTDEVTKTGGTTPRNLTYTANNLSGKVKITITCTTNSLYVLSCTIKTGSLEPTDPTAIAISPSGTQQSPLNVSNGGTKSLSVSYTPSTANQNLDVNWTSSNTSVATVDSNGVVTGKSLGTATISAKLSASSLSSIPAATCVIQVVESTKPEQTILLYICGSNLESGYDSDTKTYSADNGSQASLNLSEILAATGQDTDEVNIAIETGGSKYWYNSYGMNASKLQRWHVENQQLVLDQTLSSYTSMAKQSTFQSFVEWGLQNYPAERTGIIMWDHGNGMQGCCSDEYDSGWDMLTTPEMKSAFTSAFSNQGVSKLEWIGYDCCLMAMQDIASINADFFNYQLSSQESEPGAGWDYTGFIQPLFNNPSISTVDMLKAACDTYHTKVLATYAQYVKEGYNFYKNFDDTTLAIFDLSKMDVYVTAFENMVTSININSQTKFDTIADYAKQCYAFANTNDNGYGTGTSGVDAYDGYTFLNKLKSAYSSAGVTNVQNLYNQVVIYKVIGTTYSSHAYGMSVFVATYGQTSKTSEYTANATKFTNWRNVNVSYGTWYN